ncbi:MAG: hypothetical protein RLZZ09_2707 [Pseudomonadota bacterium]
METSTSRGARVRTSKRAPSIDLATLIQLLGESITPGHQATGQPASWPLFTWSNNKRLRINTRGVISRFLKHHKFEVAFVPGEDSGFIRDCTLPASGTDAKIGGRLFAEQSEGLTRIVSIFRHGIEQALDQFFIEQGGNVSDLVCEDAHQFLASLARSVDTPFNPNILESSVTPLQFTEPGRLANARHHDVARLIAAVEEVETRDWLDKFERPARRKLNRRGLDEDEVDGAIDNFRREAEKLDSQIIRFLDFLDDEALARVRLEITFAIMRAIREATRKRNDEGARLLVRFIDNVDRLKEKYFESDEQLALDVSGQFGVAGKVNISDYLRQAHFYRCLAVWPEPVAQMFEFRPITGGSLVREVSYRFRVNGINPVRHKSAFVSRLQSYRKVLLGETEAEPVVGRRLAELLFLSAVVPRRDKLDDEVDPLEVAAQCMEFMASDKEANPIERLIVRLEREEQTMELIAHALIETLRKRGEVIVTATERQVAELSICVQEDIIDWERLASATGSSSDFLVRPTTPGQDEKSLWFRHIVVTNNPSTVPGLLFSVKVKTLLRERTLTQTGAGESYSLQLQRRLDGPVLSVVFCPFKPRKAGDTWLWEPTDSFASWQGTAGIDVEVDESALGRKGKVKGKPDDLVQQQHAATTTAFAILVHTLLWVIRNRIVQDRDEKFVRLILIRAQQEGRRTERINPEHPVSGSEGLYAITQALELSLASEGPVFMQGFALDNINKFRNTGVFAAVSSAFPLAVGCPVPNGTPPIGLINYGTRPCSLHPAYPEEEAFLYTAKTYVAEPTQEPMIGLELREDRTQLHIQSKDAFGDPSLILEEIGRLQDLGCRHVMLLWQHYGSRRIGRTADRHAPHSSPGFLERIARGFPDLTLYVLRRDVFPATRMPKEGTRTSAFEVSRVREHEDFWHPAEQEIRRDIVPIYTFATLVVVGEETERPQSGFCTYFLESDSRLLNIEWAERARANLIDPNQNAGIRSALITVLRGLHYLHAERGVQRGLLKPKLDPYQWVNPASIGGAGEMKVMKSRRKGALVLSFPAVLAQVSSILQGSRA